MMTGQTRSACREDPAGGALSLIVQAELAWDRRKPQLLAAEGGRSDITQTPIREVRAAMDSDPAFASRWTGMLSKEVRRLRLQCGRLSLNKVQDRLIHLLETEGQQGRFPIGTGLKSLAGELGVTHEALYRTVADLEKKGTLKRDNKDIVLFSGIKA